MRQLLVSPFPPVARGSLTAYAVVMLSLIAGGCAKEPVTYQGLTSEQWSQRLEDRDEQYRVEALTALRELGRDASKSEPIIRRVVNDSDSNSWQTRIAAVVTWWHVAEEQDAVIEYLNQRLRSADEVDARFAADAVARIGPEARGTLPALKARFATIESSNAPDQPMASANTLALRESLLAAMGAVAKP